MLMKSTDAMAQLSLLFIYYQFQFIKFLHLIIMKSIFTNEIRIIREFISFFYRLLFLFKAVISLTFKVKKLFTYKLN